MKDLMKKMSVETIEAISAEDNKTILSILDSEGYPHTVLITTLMGIDENTITWAKVTYGMSKVLMEKVREISFMTISDDQRILRGHARYLHSKKTGKEFEQYNMRIQFRYNAYSGIDEVYYLALTGITPEEKINSAEFETSKSTTKDLMKGIVFENSVLAIDPLVARIFSQPQTLKFLAYAENRNSCIVPLYQAEVASSDRIVFARYPLSEDLNAIKEGTRAAVHFCTPNGITLFVQGVYETVGGLGSIKVQKVYNATSPRATYIYPRESLTAIRNFD